MEKSSLAFEPVLSHPELVSPSIFSLAQKMNNPEIMVVEKNLGSISRDTE
jgi:hypothetical protein